MENGKILETNGAVRIPESKKGNQSGPDIPENCLAKEISWDKSEAEIRKLMSNIKKVGCRSTICKTRICPFIQKLKLSDN